MRRLTALLFALGCAAQTPVSPRFETASLKRSGPMERGYPARILTGGPGTSSPTRIAYKEHSLKDLLFLAYAVSFYQLAPPAWTENAYFDIAATLPVGSTRDDARLMLQNLLAERFHLKIHREPRQMSGYALQTAAGTPKLLPSPDAEPTTALPPRLDLDKDGFVVLPRGMSNLIAPTRDGVTRLTAGRATMEQFSIWLRRQFQRPVVNETGLPGVYDFHLFFAPEATAPGALTGPPEPSETAPTPAPSLRKAVESQLGLKLSAKQVPVDVIVIDRLDRQPIED